MAGQTNWKAREVEFKLDFINTLSDYRVEYAIDGINADEDACDYIIKSESSVKNNWKIRMASGGGFAMILKKK